MSDGSLVTQSRWFAVNCMVFPTFICGHLKAGPRFQPAAMSRDRICSVVLGSDWMSPLYSMIYTLRNMKNMKNKNYHTFGTVPKSNGNIVERGSKFDVTNTHILDGSLS